MPISFAVLGHGYPINMPETTGKFREAGREQESFFAPVEKRLLVRMAHATPRWINSDHLTLLGFVSMFFAGLCYWLARWNKYMLLAVIFWLAANWLGDSLDGTLARVRNRQRPRYGFYVDHITDAFGTFFLVGGMGLSGYMSPTVAAVLAGGLFHALDPGVPGGLRARHVPTLVLEVQSHRTAIVAGGGKYRAAVPADGKPVRVPFSAVRCRWRGGNCRHVADADCVECPEHGGTVQGGAVASPVAHASVTYQPNKFSPSFQSVARIVP